MARCGSSARALEFHSTMVGGRFRKARMAVESRDTRLLHEIARPWVDALSERFGPRVESRLIEAAQSLVDQYLKELQVARQSDDDRKHYVDRAASVLAYQWWRLVEPGKTEDRPSPVA